MSSYVCVGRTQHTRGGQRTVCENQVSLYHLSSGEQTQIFKFDGKPFQQLSQVFIYIQVCGCLKFACVPQMCSMDRDQKRASNP